MNLQQFLLAVRARRGVVVLLLLVTVTAALVVSLLLPKSWVAATSMVVNYRGVDAVTGMTLPAQMMPGYVATQVEIIHSQTVALKVVDALKLQNDPLAQALLDVRPAENRAAAVPDSPEKLRMILANAVLKSVDVQRSRDSSVLTIAVKGRDPQLVAAIANGVASAYLDLSVHLKTAPAQAASAFITGQIRNLRDQYEAAQTRLSQYQQRKRIYSADNRVDVETARLNELSSQLVQVEGQLMEASSRQYQASSNAGGAPEVINNALVQTLKSRLALAESQFAVTAQRLASNHPQYIAAKSEIDELRRSLAAQIRATSTGIASNASILQRRQAELRAALGEQKAKVLALNGARDEFSVLANEVENARRAYETASQRFNQTSLEGQARQADIAILTAATVPYSPDGPKVLRNVALAAVLGLLLGISAVLLLELRDQRVRSANQLVEILGLPILGVLERPAPPPSRRHAMRLLTGPDAGSAITAMERLT